MTSHPKGAPGCSKGTRPRAAPGTAQQYLMDSSTLAPSDVRQVPVADLAVSPLNPRREKKLDQLELEQLAASIRVHGILQPLVAVRRGGRLEVLAGRRRLEAARLAGLTEVPVIERRLEDEPAAAAALVENEQRAALRPLDTALAIARRLDAGESVEQVATALGKPRGWVARRANLQKLPAAMRKRLEAPDDALRAWPLESLELLALLSPATQQDVLRRAPYVIPTAADLRKHLARECTRLDVAPWDLADAELVPKAGACSTCPFNSANTPDLFGDLQLDEKQAATAVCRNEDCWSKKVAAHAERAVATAKKEHGKDLLRVRGKNTYGEGDLENEESRGTALHDFQYKRVKPGTPGAKAAVVVSGKEIGKVIHVLVEKGAGDAAARAKPKKEAPAPGSAAAKKASVERLDRRRMAWRVDEGLKQLCAIEPPAAAVMVKLAAVFGTGGLSRGTRALGRNAMLQKVQKEFAAAGCTELWAAVVSDKHGLRDQLALRRLQDLDGAHAIVQWLTEELRGAPAWKAVVEASEVEVPAPKALQGLKQTKVAAKATRAKPKKPAPAKSRKAAATSAAR